MTRQDVRYSATPRVTTDAVEAAVRAYYGDGLDITPTFIQKQHMYRAIVAALPLLYIDAPLYGDEEERATGDMQYSG